MDNLLRPINRLKRLKKLELDLSFNYLGYNHNKNIEKIGNVLINFKNL